MMSLPNCKFNLQLRVSSGQNPDNQKLYVHICIYPKVQNSDITYTQYSNRNNFIIGDDIPKLMSLNDSSLHNIYKYGIQRLSSLMFVRQHMLYESVFVIKWSSK